MGCSFGGFHLRFCIFARVWLVLALIRLLLSSVLGPNIVLVLLATFVSWWGFKILGRFDLYAFGLAFAGYYVLQVIGGLAHVQTSVALNG
nr:AKR_HP1_G0022220.mRNA.1.CDS.1 [Saccharomyces cerevisiae]